MKGTVRSASLINCEFYILLSDITDLIWDNITSILHLIPSSSLGAEARQHSLRILPGPSPWFRSLLHTPRTQPRYFRTGSSLTRNLTSSPFHRYLTASANLLGKATSTFFAAGLWSWRSGIQLSLSLCRSRLFCISWAVGDWLCHHQLVSVLTCVFCSLWWEPWVPPWPLDQHPLEVFSA